MSSFWMAMENLRNMAALEGTDLAGANIRDLIEEDLAYSNIASHRDFVMDNISSACVSENNLREFMMNNISSACVSEKNTISALETQLNMVNVAAAQNDQAQHMINQVATYPVPKRCISENNISNDCVSETNIGKVILVLVALVLARLVLVVLVLVALVLMKL